MNLIYVSLKKINPKQTEKLTKVYISEKICQKICLIHHGHQKSWWRQTVCSKILIIILKFTFRVNKKKKQSTFVLKTVVPTATVSVSPENIRKSKRTSTRISGQTEGSALKLPKTDENIVNRVFEYVIEEIQQEGITTTTTQIDAVGNQNHVVLSLNNSDLALQNSDVISLPVADEDKLVEELAETQDDEYSMDSVSLAKSVRDLLDLLVDSSTLKKFGWPTSPVEYVSFVVCFFLNFLT